MSLVASGYFFVWIPYELSRGKVKVHQINASGLQIPDATKDVLIYGRILLQTPLGCEENALLKHAATKIHPLGKK
jgi:hypothetical protein